MGIMRLEPTKKKVQTEAEMFSVTETKCIKYELCNCDFFRTFYIYMYVCMYIYMYYKDSSTSALLEN